MNRKTVPGLTPVGFAVLLNNLRSTVRHNLIVFRLAEEGIDCSKQLTECMEIVTLAIYVAAARGEDSGPDFNVMRGAQSAMQQVAERGFKWQSRHAIAIDEGTTRALDLTTKAQPKEVRAAYIQLMQGRIAAAASVQPRE